MYTNTVHSILFAILVDLLWRNNVAQTTRSLANPSVQCLWGKGHTSTMICNVNRINICSSGSVVLRKCHKNSIHVHTSTSLSDHLHVKNGLSDLIALLVQSISFVTVPVLPTTFFDAGP